MSSHVIPVLILSPQDTAFDLNTTLDTIVKLRLWLNQKWFNLTSGKDKVNANSYSYLKHLGKSFVSFRIMLRILGQDVADCAYSHEAFAQLFEQAFPELYPVVAVQIPNAIWKKGWVQPDAALTALAMVQGKKEVIFQFPLPALSYKGFHDDDGDLLPLTWSAIANAHLMDTEPDYASFIEAMNRF